MPLSRSESAPINREGGGGGLGLLSYFISKGICREVFVKAGIFIQARRGRWKPINKWNPPSPVITTSKKKKNPSFKVRSARFLTLRFSSTGKKSFLNGLVLNLPDETEITVMERIYFQRSHCQTPSSHHLLLGVQSAPNRLIYRHGCWKVEGFLTAVHLGWLQTTVLGIQSLHPLQPVRGSIELWVKGGEKALKRKIPQAALTTITYGWYFSSHGESWVRTGFMSRPTLTAFCQLCRPVAATIWSSMFPRSYQGRMFHFGKTFPSSPLLNHQSPWDCCARPSVVVGSMNQPPGSPSPAYSCPTPDPHADAPKRPSSLNWELTLCPTPYLSQADL